MISKQLALYVQNKEVFVSTFTQEGYNKKVIELLSKLPDPVADAMNVADASDKKEDDIITRLFNE